MKGALFVEDSRSGASPQTVGAELSRYQALAAGLDRTMLFWERGSRRGEGGPHRGPAAYLNAHLEGTLTGSDPVAVGWQAGKPVVVEELSCFAPAMLLLGAVTADSTADTAAADTDTAAAIARGCLNMHHDPEVSAVGLPPDIIFAKLDPSTRDISLKTHSASPGYRLRPETIESIFYLSRLAKTAADREAWRDVGWAIFEAIEAHCKRPAGYTALLDVRRLCTKEGDHHACFGKGGSTERGDPDIGQPSYFLAETLKYCELHHKYQLFCEFSMETAEIMENCP